MPIPRDPRARLWPAVLATFLASMGFASLKFVLITQIAFAFDPTTHVALSPQWVEDVLQRCLDRNQLPEAVSQGLAAVLTAGVLVGFAVNSPLAGAWQCAPLFAISCALVGVGSLLTVVFNPWWVSFLVGIAYGTACAARGKVIPLVAGATGRHTTFVSGVMNAALVVGLLAGTVFGNILGDNLMRVTRASWAEPWMAQVVIAAFMAVATAMSFLVYAPDPHPIPFRRAAAELVSSTVRLVRLHWPLLIGGGLIWGITSAASLGVLVYSVDKLGFSQTQASSIALFAAIGAIAGNLVSDWLDRRRWVLLCLLGLAGGCAGFDPLVQLVPEHWHYAMAATLMVIMGFCFAAPANVLDARLMHLTGLEGESGRGSTVMSMVHNVFILGLGASLAVPLFLTWITAQQQFLVMAGFSVLAMGVCLFARLNDRPQD